MSTRGLARHGALLLALFPLISLAGGLDTLKVTGRVRGELGAWSALPGQTEWRGRLELAAGPWTLQGDARRRDGELGALPHAAGRLLWRGPAGWVLGLGDHAPASDLQASLGRGRGGLPTRLRGGLRSGPGALSRSNPAERGVLLECTQGVLRGGLLAAATRRDLRSDGQGFLLDLEHTDDTRQRQGAWQDRLALAWGTLEGPGGWDLQALAGRRHAPAGGGMISGGSAIQRRPERQLALALDVGESRLVLLQGIWLRGKSELQADLWRGQRGSTVFSRPALPLGDATWSGGWCLQSRFRGRMLAARLAVRRLDAAARGTERPALWWSAEMEKALGPAGSGLLWGLRHSAAENRPSGSGREEWRLSLRPHSTRPLDWALSWQQARDAAGVVRWARLELARSWKLRHLSHGAKLQLLVATGTGATRLVPFSLGPGLLKYGGVSGQRQLWGGGWWGRWGAQQLSVGLLVKEAESEDGAVVPESVLQVRWVYSPED